MKGKSILCLLFWLGCYLQTNAQVSDIETINTELALADLQTLEKAIPRLEKEVRLQKEKIVELEEAKKAQELLGAGKLISASNLDQDALRPLQLLTAKAFLYVFNVDENFTFFKKDSESSNFIIAKLQRLGLNVKKVKCLKIWTLKRVKSRL